MPPSNSTPPAPPATRWLQLIIGVVCMVMIANLQYGWTLFVQPIDQKYGWGRPAIQVAFSIFVITEAWLVPLEGWFVDHFGPRLIVTIGGLLVGAAWLINAFADSRFLLYVGAALGGIGVGCVWHVLGKRPEMVPRPARACDRHHRRGLRRRLSLHHHSDPAHHSFQRLRSCGSAWDRAWSFSP
jgi:MFS family permease